ncbi:unnamed protein product [Alopecurus aequalis]
MSIADDAVNPSPPALALLLFVLDTTLALLRVAARALAYLCIATAWVLSAICAATVGAHLAWGEGSAPFLFLLALTEAAGKVRGALTLMAALAAVLLCGRCLLELVAGSGSEFKKIAFGAITQHSTQGLFRFLRIVVLGLVADLAFFLLICAGSLVMMMSSPVEGSISQGEMIGSVIVDVGLFGIHAVYCFVIFPAVVLSFWMKDKVDTKQSLVFLRYI